MECVRTFCAGVSFTGVAAKSHRLPEEFIKDAIGEHDGIKLKKQVLITETGCENLTRCPLDERLMV